MHGLDIVLHTLEVQATIKEWIFFGFLHRFLKHDVIIDFLGMAQKIYHLDSVCTDQNRTNDWMDGFPSWDPSFQVGICEGRIACNPPLDGDGDYGNG